MGVPADKLQQVFSAALEQRSSETQDLVSNANVVLYTMKQKKMFKPYSGPTIRERINYAQTGSGIWYSGYDFLNPTPGNIIRDAEWVPKQLVVSPTISMEEILQTSGKNALVSLFDMYLDVAQNEISDVFTASLHSDGTGFNGIELTGLRAAIPTVTTSGTYAGINRATETWWRTGSYDAQTAFPGIGTQITSATIQSFYRQIVIERSRGKDGPDLILADQNHFSAYSEGLEAIQRVISEKRTGTRGFPSVKFAGAGREIDIVLEGGIGTNMPSDTSYFIDTKSLCVRYHPDRYFKPFGGKQMPINQDAIVQHIGFMGELTLKNPLHMAKLYDSNTGS